MAERVLIFDTDPSSALKLAGTVQPELLIQVVGEPEKVKVLLQKEEVHLLLLDFLNLTNAPELIALIQNSSSLPPLALFTDASEQAYFPHLLEWDIFNMFSKRSVYSHQSARKELENLIHPERGFGLAGYFDRKVKSIRIRTRSDRETVVQKIMDYFVGAGFYPPLIYDIRLVLEELVNNALFHAFVGPVGKPKYDLKDFQQLEGNEEVSIDYLVAGERLGFAVTDNAGRLTRERVIRALLSQYERRALSKTSGRGIYLCRQLAEKVIFNLAPGRESQVMAFFSQFHANLPKPLFINWVP